MAIQKTKNLRNGTSGNYWKITKENYNKVTMVATIEITLFKDRDTAISTGADLGMRKNFTGVMTHDQLSGNRTAEAYTMIKDQANAPVRNLSTGEVVPGVKADMDLADGTDV